MVCLGNICRSPLAEGILKSKLPDDFTVDSAGTLENNAGKSPDHRSVSTAQKYNIDISDQRSRLFVAQDFQKYDRIYVMDKSNLKNVLSFSNDEDERQKVSLILGDQEVPDPFWSEIEDFDKVYKMLDKASDKIAEELKESVLKEPGKSKKSQVD